MAVTQNIVLQGCNNKYGRSTAHARAEPQQQAPRIAVPGIAFGGGGGVLAEARCSADPARRRAALPCVVRLRCCCYCVRAGRDESCLRAVTEHVNYSHSYHSIGVVERNHCSTATLTRASIKAREYWTIRSKFFRRDTV
jgi:hypothetical protein